MSRDATRTFPASSFLLVAAQTDGSSLWTSATQVYLGDSTIVENSSLKRYIDDGKWINLEIPDLTVASKWIRRYLFGNCAFSKCVKVKKTCSEQDIAENHILSLWDPIAFESRKTIECAFDILK